MGNDVNNYLSFSDATSHKSLKTKGTSLTSRLHKGLETLLKSLMKRL